MRTIDSQLQDACETGAGIPIATAVITPFALPSSLTDIGAIDTATDADSGNSYIIRVRAVGAAVQINRFLRSAYATAANWNSWTTIYTESANIELISIFINTDSGTPRTEVNWKKAGNTNIFGMISFDEGATWGPGIETTISTANTINLLKGYHNGGFIYRNATGNELLLHAYRASDANWVINTIPVPDTADKVDGVSGSKRTIYIDGVATDVCTVALISITDAGINDHKLWIGSALNYLTTSETWVAATVLRGIDEFAPERAFSIFNDYISFRGPMAADVVCKLIGYYGITYGYLAQRGLATLTVIGQNNDSLIFKEGFYSTIDVLDEEEDVFTVIEYQATRESIQVRVTSTATPVDGTIVVSRGYHTEADDFIEPLTPYRIISWRTNPDRTFTIQGVTGYMALQGRPLPPGMQINITRAQTYRLCFATVGIFCALGNDDIIADQPFPDAEPSITSLSAAITRISNAGSIEIWPTEYGVRADATPSTSSTQTITPDGGLLPHKDYSQAIGLHASFLSSGFNTISNAIEADGGYPYFPYAINFPYNPADYDEDLVENLHKERQFSGFFHTRANMSLECGDVITIAASDLRIVDIIENFGSMFMQEIRYRWHTEPLSLGDYGITPTEKSTSSISIAPIQGHTHGGVVEVAEAIHAAAEKTTLADADEFGIADSAANYILKKLTWNNFKTNLSTWLGTLITSATSKNPPVGSDSVIIQSLERVTFTNLRTFFKTTYDSLYAAIANGVTNGDSHDHAGGDGAQIAHTGLSSIGTNTHAQIDTHIATGAHVTNGDSHNHVGGDGAALTYIDVIAAFGNGTTVPASSTYFMQYGIAGTAAAYAAMPWPVGGTLKNLTFRISGTQPASGSLVVTMLVNNVATALTLTVPAGGTGPTYTDSSNTVAFNAGDTVKFQLQNNATATSTTIAGISVQLQSNTG